MSFAKDNVPTTEIRQPRRTFLLMALLPLVPASGLGAHFAAGIGKAAQITPEEGGMIAKVYLPDQVTQIVDISDKVTVGSLAVAIASGLGAGLTGISMLRDRARRNRMNAQT